MSEAHPPVPKPEGPLSSGELAALLGGCGSDDCADGAAAGPAAADQVVAAPPAADPAAAHCAPAPPALMADLASAAGAPTEAGDPYASPEARFRGERVLSQAEIDTLLAKLLGS